MCICTLSGRKPIDYLPIHNIHVLLHADTTCLQIRVHDQIDSFHIVISLSNRSSIEKSIKLDFENEGADCLLVAAMLYKSIVLAFHR